MKRWMIDAGLAATVLTLAAFWFMPKIGGYLWPVVTHYQITQLVGTGYGYTTFASEAVKQRNCVWIETRWYVGTRAGPSSLVAVRYNGPPKANAPGHIAWPSTTVSLDPASLSISSYADVVHDCYGGWLWLTVTEMYTGVSE
jgi:hypothetical protein